MLGAVVVFQDITEQKQIQKELERLLEGERERVREAQLFEAVLENTPSVIAYMDKETRYLLVNQAYVATSGRKREEIVGRSALEFFPQPEYQAAFARAVATGRPVSRREAPLELPARPEAGITYWDFTLTPVKTNGAEVTGVLLTATEVTDKVRARQRIAAAERERAKEARLLGVIQEAVPNMLAYLDRELRYVHVNSRYAQAVGRTPEEVVGRSFTEILGRDRYAMMALESARETGETIAVREMPPVAPRTEEEARTERFDVLLTPVKDELGNVEGLVLSVTDVTQQVQTRERIAAAERERAREARLLATILEATPSMIAYLDRDLRYVHVNTFFAEMLGLVRQEVVGRLHPEFFAHAPWTIELLQGAMDTGESAELREVPPAVPIPWLPPGEGSFDVTVVPVRDEGGEIEGVVVFVMDVTDRVRQREQLVEVERARAELAETLNREINHRVKNNLMMVVGLLQMQIAGQRDPRTAEALHDAMTRLLTFAEIHTQLRFAPTEEIDLLQGIRHIADVIRGVFAKARVELSVAGRSVPCPAKSATPILIIANELITNAIKHGGPAEDGRLHVEIEVAVEEGKMRISIWNSGPPVPEDFDPSAQATMGLRLVWDVVVTRYEGTFSLRPERGGNRAELVVEYEELRKEG